VIVVDKLFLVVKQVGENYKQKEQVEGEEKQRVDSSVVCIVVVFDERFYHNILVNKQCELAVDFDS
jgi:hypothetical protein